LSFEDLADDPPRDDYERTTVPRPAAIDLSVLGTSEVEVEFRRFAEPMILATAEISALVRATERAMGADLAGEPVWAEARRTEADLFRSWASEHLRSQAEATPRFAAALSIDLWVPSRRRPSGSVFLEEELSAESVSSLYRMGIPLSVIRTEVPDPMGKERNRPEDFGWTLMEASDADLRVAQILDDGLANDS
jgi:hypothetical protein